MIANTARVSYDKFSHVLGLRDEKLLKFLAENNHTSPFRHAQIQFRIECPIFVERQIFTHTVGIAKNSISGRYVDFSDNYWLPSQLRFQSKDSKQGSSGDLPNEQNDIFLTKMQHIIDACRLLYKEMSDYGVAKEQCRIHLPLCLETKFIWTGSFQAFVHLCNMRLKPDTQKETRQLVQQMLDAVKEIDGNPFKYSLEAWKM
jgi:thymidylate synthase (FAD)